MSTIKSSKEIDRVFRGARRIADPIVISLIMSTINGRDPQGRVAVIAGKRLGNAVTRNRAKRLLRAAVSTAGGPWAGYDVVLIARESTLRSTSDEVASAISRALGRAGIVL